MFVLGTWQQADGQRGFDVHPLVDITRQEFDAYLESIATYRAVTERHTYQLLHRNWNQLTSMHRMYANIERVGGTFRTVDKRVISVGFMSLVTNWLTATRLYLEANRDSISQRFGEASDEFRRYKAATNGVFDSNVGYRFLYNLRDYAQHCGPPLGGLVVAANADGSRSLQLYLSRSDLLLAKFNWSKHARKLLDGWPDKIFLLPLIEEAMSGYRKIENEVLALLLEYCGTAIPRLREGIGRVGVAEGHPAVFQIQREVPREESGQFAFQSFPTISMIDVVEDALSKQDPISVLRTDRTQEGEPRTEPGMLHSDDQAAAVVGTWLTYGSGPELSGTIDRILREDRDVTPLVSGLVNMSVFLLEMLAQSLGASKEDLLGTFVSDRHRRDGR